MTVTEPLPEGRTELASVPPGPGEREAIASGPIRWLSVGAVVGIAFAAWGFLVGSQPFRDNSFLTHLATGRIILDAGIPRSDPYTFTAAGEPWVVQSWLASALYAGLERLGGLDAIRWFIGAQCALLGAAVWALTKRAGGLLPRVGLAGVAIVIGTGAWDERPLLFGLLGLAACLLASENRLDPRWLAPIAWVWVNAHGSWPYGVGALVLLAVARRFDSESPAAELRALRWLGFGIVFGALNPLGPTLLTFPFIQVGGRSELLGYLVEWQPPRFDEIDQLAFVVLVAAGILLVARRTSWRAALPLAAAVVLALLAARNIPVAGLLVLPGLAGAAGGLGSVAGERRTPANVAAALAVVALTVALVSVQLQRLPFDESGYPRAAIDWLDERGLMDEGAPRLGARELVGNYLAARYGPTGRIFVDDRFDVFPADLVRDADALLKLREPAAVLDRWDIGIVVWEADAPLAEWLAVAPGWRIVHEVDDWVVACRLDAAGASDTVCS